jgi:hypothetical protein
MRAVDMLLSIFNSRGIRIISGALLTSLLLLLGYHFAVLNHLVPIGAPNTVAATEWHRLEKYVYEVHTAPVVAIGSSLLNTILVAPPSSPHIENFCLPGSSAVDGLRAMASSGKYPTVLLVEMSSRMAIPETGGIAELLGKYRQQVVSRTPMLRQAYQPSLVLASMLFPGTQASPALGDPIAKEIRAHYTFHSFRRCTASLSTRDKKALAENLAKLGEAIQVIREHGGQVILLQVPLDQRITHGKYETEALTTMKQVFPPNKYTWILPEERTWNTIDGTHLTKEDASDFKQQLLKRMNDLSLGTAN